MTKKETRKINDASYFLTESHKEYNAGRFHNAVDFAKRGLVAIGSVTPLDFLLWNYCQSLIMARDNAQSMIDYPLSGLPESSGYCPQCHDQSGSSIMWRENDNTLHCYNCGYSTSQLVTTLDR